MSMASLWLNCSFVWNQNLKFSISLLTMSSAILIPSQKTMNLSQTWYNHNREGMVSENSLHNKLSGDLPIYTERYTRYLCDNNHEVAHGMYGLYKIISTNLDND